MECMFCRSHYTWGSAARVIIFSVFLSLWVEQISAKISIVPIPKTPAVGENILLSVSITERFLPFSWHRGETTNDNNRILSYSPIAFPSQQTYFPYESRLTGFPNGSIEITGVKISDSGSYTLQIPFTGLRASANITVYEILDKPIITTSFPHPVEHGDSVTLTCVTSSTAQTILWSKDSQSLPSDDRMSLSMNNRTLNICNVSNTDSGNYRCEVINPVSRSMSELYTLTINSAQPDTPLQIAVGAAVGAVLGAALLITTTVLLYMSRNNCWKGKNGVGQEEYSVPKARGTSPALYQNIIHPNPRGTSVNIFDPTAPGSAYTDLQFRNQSFYSDLNR